MKRILTSFLLLAAMGVSPCIAQSTAPSAESATPTTQPNLGALIDQLNDPDPQLREQATKDLWKRGRSAEPALKQAAESGPPEVKRRAKSILRDFNYGLYPDSPPEIFALLDQFRNGEIDQKRSALWMLNGMGTPGLRVLMKLHEEVRDPQSKQLLDFVLAPRQHDVATLMIADGETRAVERMLETAGNQGGAPWMAIEDYVAYLTLTGKVRGEFEKHRNEPITPRSAPMRMALARAVGDSDAARDAAEKVMQPEALDAMLAGRGDWKALADRLNASPQRIEAIERLGLICACYRLAGEEGKCADAARQLVAQADQTPQNYLFCSKNLMLNSFPDEAEKILLDHADYLSASNYLGSRLEFDKALELPVLALQRQPAEALKVKAESAQTLHFIGKNDEAKHVLDEVSRENRERHDLTTSLALIDSAYEIGQPKLVDQYASDALAVTTTQDPIPAVFERMRLGDGEAATLWWRLLRDDRPNDAASVAVGTIRAIMEGTIAPDDLARLASVAEKKIAQFPAPEREPWQQTIAATLAGSKMSELATKWFDRLAATSTNPTVLIRTGDFSAEQSNWKQAAERYASACERDPARCDAWLLRGWALSHVGNATDSNTFIHRADLQALGNEAARRMLLEAMKKHGMSELYRNEIKLILSITPPRSYERSETLRDAAEMAANDGDAISAAHYWDEAFLQNFSINITFQEPWANVLVPALVHKTRALGLIGQGKTEDAMKQARLTMKMTPADADAVIDIVNALDKAGHHSEAEAFYREQTQFYKKLTATYPNSGSLFNQLAWSQAMCHRELDDALKNADRAVELEPTNTASIDTLAECYFATGDAKQAAEEMKKCVKLEPGVQRHRRQLARFEKATTQPATRE